MEDTLAALESIGKTFEIDFYKINDCMLQVFKKNTKLFRIEVTQNGLVFLITRNNINYFKKNNIFNFISFYNACRLFLNTNLYVYEKTGNVNNNITNCL